MRRHLLILFLWIPTTIVTMAFSLLLLTSGSVKLFRNSDKEVNASGFGVNAYQLYASVPELMLNFTTNIQTADARPEILRNFFEKYDSPLSNHSFYLVEIADTYNLDFRLLPAIAMQESNLCKKIPANSHNCWGFGIYGDKVTNFDSYEQGAEIVAKTLRSKYVDKGFISPEEIMSKYTPSSNGSWASAVNHFMDIMQ